MRKAIEDVNSGNVLVNQLEDAENLEKEPTPEKQPLLAQTTLTKDINGNPAANVTVTSIDSNLSNSDNCSDIELSNITDPKDETKLVKQ